MDSHAPSAGGRPPLPTETELKLRIEPDAAARLSRHPALSGLKRARARSARLLSTYFDTADGLLATAGIALRLRRDGRRWVQTIKGPADATRAGGLTSRTEYEWPVAGAALDPLRFGTTPFRRVLGKAEKRGLVPRFTTDIARTSIPLTFPDSTMATLCIDRGEVRTEDAANPLHQPIHEIEIELEAGNVLRLFELAQTLARDVPLQVEIQSKAERGLALLAPRAAIPARAVDADVAGKALAGAALAAIMRACLAQIEGNVCGLLHDDDPEWIHQMRIGVRRLRACLSLARRGIAPARIEPLRTELRWLAHALGAARDYDVFATETLPAFRAAVGGGSGAAALQPALRQLQARAQVRRKEARVIARAAVASPRFVRLILGIAALAATPLEEAAVNAAVDDSAVAGLTLPARDFARPLLKRRHRTLLELGHDLAHAAPEARHAARLAAKKLRYATEFFAPLFPRKRTRKYRRALTVLQDELGAWNDAAVAARLAAELAGAQSPAAAAFSGWAAARGVERAAALAAAWGGFTATRVFWARD